MNNIRDDLKVHTVVLNGAREAAVGRGHTNGSQFLVGFDVELLELGEDVLAVGELAQVGDVRSDLVDECLPLLHVTHLNHLLDDVVGELVLHHAEERAVVEAAHLLDEHGALRSTRVSHALLHNIAVKHGSIKAQVFTRVNVTRWDRRLPCKLVLTQGKNFASQL